MPDWIAPAATCLAILLLLLLSERFGDRPKDGAKANARDDSERPKPAREEKQPRADADRQQATPAKAAAPAQAPSKSSKSEESSDGPDSIEILTVEVTSSEANVPAASASGSKKSARDELPRLDDPEDDSVDPTKVGMRAATIQPPTKRIVYDADAATEEPTSPGALILVTASAQTDKGMRRKRNEDSLLVMEQQGVFVVADGMGGYSGGEIASRIAVQTIQEAFDKQEFGGEPHEAIPRRASEMARAIQMANDAILAYAASDRKLEGMGTTVCAARFSPNKQRLYVAHVGDSRMYRVRAGALKQMTSDHTMRDLGVTGPGSDHLSRAVGVWPTVPIDVLLAKPIPGDTYLLCSDGLTKMIDDKTVARVLSDEAEPLALVENLVRTANERGGKDNITAILIRVHGPRKGKA